MECKTCIIIEKCSKCEKPFNLAYDLEKVINKKFKEPIKETLNEKCGVKDILCWKCRIGDY
ncbi:MAG: hypothetical protein IIA87_04270 [Nanoarchaeota archaeon]|nr:hypothetical protein [Nanoarchaeota archaeon]